jgi:hypothetical protein
LGPLPQQLSLALVIVQESEPVKHDPAPQLKTSPSQEPTSVHPEHPQHVQIPSQYRQLEQP